MYVSKTNFKIINVFLVIQMEDKTDNIEVISHLQT